jgi:alkylated DNA repair dioxygenase AlkB
MTSEFADPAVVEELGLTLVPEFITPEEEQLLLPLLVVGKSEAVNERVASNYTGRSSVQRYGSSVPYPNYIVSPTIPPHFGAILSRLVEQNYVIHRPDSVTINEYLPGAEIYAHIDASAAGGVITVLSLAAPAVMVLELKKKNIRHAVLLPPRSLVQLRGPSRYVWTHEILPVEATRYSLVFRCSRDSH